MSDPDASGPASSDNPEQLLAEALRAQARSAPPSPAVPPAQQGSTAESTDALPALADGPPAGYGLLSGADPGSLERERAALPDLPDQPAPPEAAAAVPRESPTRRSSRQGRQLASGWILLLAVLLGLATGSVIGLLTLL